MLLTSKPFSPSSPLRGVLPPSYPPSLLLESCLLFLYHISHSLAQTQSHLPHLNYTVILCLRPLTCCFVSLLLCGFKYHLSYGFQYTLTFDSKVYHSVTFTKPFISLTLVTFLYHSIHLHGPLIITYIHNILPSFSSCDIISL